MRAIADSVWLVLMISCINDVLDQQWDCTFGGHICIHLFGVRTAFVGKAHSWSASYLPDQVQVDIIVSIGSAYKAQGP